jgi:signal transduction histidine kinase
LPNLADFTVSYSITYSLTRVECAILHRLGSIGAATLSGSLGSVSIVRGIIVRTQGILVGPALTPATMVPNRSSDICYDRVMRSLIGIFIWLMVILMPAISAAAETLPRSVLILDPFDGSYPWAFARNAAFRTTLNTGRAVPISIYEEYLNLDRFAGANYRESMQSHFREKYRGKPIGMIVTFGPLALDYAMHMRAELWPEVPIVFGEVAEAAISQSRLAAVTGSTIHFTLDEMVVAARALMPNIRRIALVGDPLDRLPVFRHFIEEIPVVTRDLGFMDLTGLATVDLRRRVATLPGDTVILYTAISFDGAGVSYIPAEALSLVAEVANRPIMINTETYMGRGAVGGLLLTPGSVGREAARLASRVFNGEDPSTIPVTNTADKPIFDWRQLQRWGISTARLPAGSEIRFRELTVWEQYRLQIMLIAAALLIQTALIIRLFYEHRQRRSAEATSLSAMVKLAHMNRITTASELTASIAHEVNQPLGAMVANANAGLRWLTNKTPDLDRARAALQRIVSDGHRAGAVIASIRAMFRKDVRESAPVDLNDLIEDVLGHVRGELQIKGILVQIGLTKPLPLVLGHGGELQQVVLNLVRNAADAMALVSGRIRVLRVKSAIHDPAGVLVSVEDSGTGIDLKDIDRIFEAFFTTKTQGMGMGLSICRTIIEAHGGRLWASSDIDHGSVFNVQLPTVRPGVIGVSPTRGPSVEKAISPDPPAAKATSTSVLAHALATSRATS